MSAGEASSTCHMESTSAAKAAGSLRSSLINSQAAANKQKNQGTQDIRCASRAGHVRRGNSPKQHAKCTEGCLCIDIYSTCIAYGYTAKTIKNAW